MTAATAEALGVQEGDYFVCSWGYDQTNIDFYKVLALSPSGKTLTVQQWASKRVDGDGSHDRVVPGDGPATNVCWAVDLETGQRDYNGPATHVPVEPMTKRLAKGFRGAAFTVNSYSAALLWDGKAESQTNPLAGH